MISKAKIGALLFLLLSLGYGWIAMHIPLDFWSQAEVFTARTLPEALACGGIVVALLILFTTPIESGWGALAGLQWRPALALIALMVVYGAILEPLGFVLGSILFLIAGFLIMGERSAWRLLLASLPLVIGFWFVVGQLGIYLDHGTLIRAWMEQ